MFATIVRNAYISIMLGDAYPKRPFRTVLDWMDNRYLASTNVELRASVRDDKDIITQIFARMSEDAKKFMESHFEEKK